MGCADCDHDSAQPVLTGDLTIALAGNPNCGKTALFNALTGVRQRTGNWPGVTVERKQGQYDRSGSTVNVIDLPGIYSLDATSLDEQITRDYLLSQDADLFVNVVDASNLERNLYLTVQLLEMNVPIVVALNMVDVATKAGLEIDIAQLERALGCRVLPVVATEGRGLDALSKAIDALAVQDPTESQAYFLAHDEPIEAAITKLQPLVQEQTGAENARWIALKLLENDPLAVDLVTPEIRQEAIELAKAIEARTGEEADLAIADERFGHAHAIAQRIVTKTNLPSKNVSDRIDRLALSRRWGALVFLAIMYAMFVFTITIGGAFIDLFDGIAGAIFVDGFGWLLTSLRAPDWLRVLLADGAGGGVQVVATFIPIVGALFLFLSFLEDSGYMARAAFVMDRAMRSIGLPGKAFVPMIVGFGCNVPAVMATRTLESDRERKLTILMNPFMSCGARLPVYALFTAAFFPRNGQNIIFALYLIGILAAIGTGMIMKKSLLSGQSEGFLMELPTYHRPTMKGLALRTWDRVRLFVREAGKIIIIMVLILSFLNSLGTDGSFGQEDSENSALSEIARTATPVFAPIGISDDNWPATVGIISGVLAKEVVVGSLDALYNEVGEEDSTAGSTDDEFNFLTSVGDSLATVPANLGSALSSIVHPFGLGRSDESEPAASDATFGAMASRFDGQIGAFAYLLFILLYFPCVATIGAIAREAGKPWAAFVAFWTTAVAYYVATVFYQGATLGRHPLSSGLWIGGASAAVAALIVGLRWWGSDKRHSDPVSGPTDGAAPDQALSTSSI